jgi:uncharacterized protein (DUF2141 family)
MLGIFLIFLSMNFRLEETGKLVVTLSNIKKTGKVHVGLYREGETFPDKKFQVKSLTGDCKDDCKFEFDAIPFGEYAIAVYQDENGNGKLDTGFFGIPSEPFAFSNNFKPRFGGPSFEKCRFSFSKESQSIQIEMINSLFGGN